MGTRLTPQRDYHDHRWRRRLKHLWPLAIAVGILIAGIVAGVLVGA